MTTKSIPYVIKTNGSVTMYLSGESVTVGLDHPNYKPIIDALKSADWASLPDLVNIHKAVENYVKTSKGTVTIESGVVKANGLPLHNTLTIRILKMMNEGFKFDHMLRFVENLLENPSKRAVDETYTFLENFGLPITEDGCFLAYKAVRNDYYDIHTGKTNLNTVGSIQKMARNLVDDEFGRDCSQGLHVGALKYVVDYGHFRRGEKVNEGGNRLLIVKVNPKNVVCVPKYEDSTKMRVCEYTVVDEIKDKVTELSKIVYSSDAKDLKPDAWAPKPSKDVAKVVADEAVKTLRSSSKKDTKEALDALLKTTITFNTTFKVDTTSPWNAEAYLSGFSDGDRDLEHGNDYGFSRNYSRENSYRIGYNDAYNSRPNQAVKSNGVVATPVIDTTSPWNEEAYREGYMDGEDDLYDGEEYGENRDYSRENSYRIGYNDGFNCRPNAADQDEKDDSDDCCGCGECCCGNGDGEDNDYSRGYTLGESDAERGLSYQFNLDVDASDSFKAGYNDGYNA